MKRKFYIILLEFPVNVIFLRHTVYFPGYNIRSLMRTRDHLQRLARQTNHPALRLGYRNFKREVKHEVKREVKF